MDTGIKIIKGLLITLLLLPSLAWGQEYARMNPYILGGGVAAAATTNFCDGFSGILCEDFYGEADCYTDDATYNNCRVAWAEGACTSYDIVYNDTTLTRNVLLPKQAVDCSIAYDFGSNQSEIWTYNVFKITTGASNNTAFVGIQDSGGVERMGLRLDDSGTTLRVLGGSSTVATMTVGNEYQLWTYGKFNSASSTLWACFTSDNVAPTVNSDCSSLPNNCSCVSGVNNTADYARKIKFINYDPSDVYGQYIKNIKVKASAIGNNGS
jgi:hypothetical protein